MNLPDFDIVQIPANQTVVHEAHINANAPIARARLEVDRIAFQVAQILGIRGDEARLVRPRCRVVRVCRPIPLVQESELAGRYLPRRHTSAEQADDQENGQANGAVHEDLRCFAITRWGTKGDKDSLSRPFELGVFFNNYGLQKRCN